MEPSFKKYMSLVQNSMSGAYQLPRFQRPYKWGPKDVMALYDSLRKDFPVGSMLFASAKTPLQRDPLEYTGEITKDAELLILDGQQRLTAGMILFMGTHPNKFFLDLRQLEVLLEKDEINIMDADAVKKFCFDLDETDGYMSTKKMTKKLSEKNAKTQLMNNDLLFAGNLIDQRVFWNATNQYTNDRKKQSLMNNVVQQHFVLPGTNMLPVVTLDEDDSLTALTRIFTTTNTTGKNLTPIEIVFACLIGQNVDLRKELDELKKISNFLAIVDPKGEILLQTIALIDNKSPKKSQLPKTITAEMFNDYCFNAMDAIDAASEFLTNEFSVGLNETKDLLPYDSILPPLACVFHNAKLKPKRVSSDNKKKLLQWFIGSALSQRYQEGVHNKQSGDAKEIEDWLSKGEMPTWLTETTIPLTLKSASPTGALGKLVKCVINKNQPIDPAKKSKVGFYSKANEAWSENVLWKKSDCENMTGWSKERDKHNIIMNRFMVSASTQKKWNKQHTFGKGENLKGKNEVFEAQLMTKECVTILSKKTPTKKDFDKFVNTRLKSLIKEFKKYGFKMGTQDVFDYED